MGCSFSVWLSPFSISALSSYFPHDPLVGQLAIGLQRERKGESIAGKSA
jgi:hypothetical protein